MINPNRIIPFFFAMNAMLFNSCQQPPVNGFQLLPAEQTGVDFINEITENDSLNILVSEFVYNGGGVAVGDLNGDGLDDLFFCGNQVENAVYLNKGNLQFQNITEQAGIQKRDPLEWSSGVNMLDINLDGRMDIYVCNTLRKDSTLRRNLLFVNQGNDENGIPSFSEMATEYGIDDDSHSSHAQFFDYDNDGDLDLFVGVNVIEGEYPNQFIDIKMDGTGLNRDNLFQNNWDDELGHPVFEDVSLAAGLLQDGYSHSTLIHDFNQDGWQDIYVANDYQSNDLIFINNQDGTFTNRSSELFKHFSLSAMGSDVSDINNDGQADFFTSEMQPYYNKRKKLFQGGSSYQSQQLTEYYGYDYQYTRNTLQLNLGENPETGLPIFAEIGMYAKVQETDWSWSTLFADYDNDGWKDLFIANGFPRDVTDRDFADFRAMASNLVSNEELYEAIPEIKIPNFLFRNNGDLTFEDVSKAWQLDIPSFSNGAAYADLDNDGDLDLIANNIDDEAFIFENKVSGDHHYLRVKLQGPEKNLDAFGTTVELIYDGQKQKNYLISGRGYLSKSESALHFGLGDYAGKIDTLLVNWPDGMVSLLKNVAIDQILTISYQEVEKFEPAKETAQAPVFASVAGNYGIDYANREIDFIDFNFQRTLPHKFSQYGPSMAVADVTGDGLDDVFLGGSGTYTETWLIQQADGQFMREEVNYKQHEKLYEEDTGSLLFDADGDGDQDLYIVRGSGQFRPGDTLYQDVLYLNDGKGNFTHAKDAVPEMRANGSCVKAADFDKDGDLDLFVGSRVLPISFPLSDRSYLLRNDTEGGNVKFTDITNAVSPELLKPGMVSDAIWTDFNGDNWPDLILAVGWMAIKVYQNNEGTSFTDISQSTGLEDQKGWWNSLAAADLDNDGDMDYIAGNFGENLYYQCTSDQPIKVYGKDLDDNGMIDPLISCYWRDSLGNKKEFLYHPRQDLIKQFVGIRKKYNTYGEYGEATVSEMFSEEEMNGALILSANWMKTSVIENLGNGQFQMKALPVEAQLAPVYGILPYDVNNDGWIDLLLIGNDHGVEVQQGRADAFNGLVLLNSGDFTFKQLSLEESHFLVPEAGIGLAKIKTATDETLLLAAQNRAELRVFKATAANTGLVTSLNHTEVKAKFYYADGSVRLEEFFWGDGFMAQSGRFVRQEPGIEKIELIDAAGEVSRTLGTGL